jgi:hypothetical protein
MLKQGKSWGKAVWLTIIALLVAGSLGIASTTKMPTPGSVNFLQGQVMLDGHQLKQGSKTTAVLQPNQVLDTQQGKAELLLTPGVFMRVGDDSAVKMISPDLADTTVALTKGSAILEVDQLFRQNDLSVMLQDAKARILTKGLYDFDANPSTVAVLDGRAIVREGDRKRVVTKGREVATDGAPLKRRKFDRKALDETSLYRWSKLRDEYEAEANRNAAENVMDYGGWYGAGWYWAPFWNFYTFLPGAGFYSPFGWAFYPPFAFSGLWGWGGYGYAPLIGKAGHAMPHFGHTIRPAVRTPEFGAAVPHMAPHFAMGGFRGRLGRG